MKITNEKKGGKGEGRRGNGKKSPQQLADGIVEAVIPRFKD